MTSRAEAIQRKKAVYRKDPVLFSREALRFTPDDWQAQVLTDLATSPKISVRSGQGVGKTCLEAVALLWFLACFPYARVVATAPTRQQLHSVLWAEVAKWQQKSALLRHILVWTKTRVYMKTREERWFAEARTAAKPENMQGFHEDNMLFIVDEASGVGDAIMEAILGTLSGDNNKLLLCGNPTRTTGIFYNSFHADRARYKCHTVSSLDSPRTNRDNIDFLINKFGEESNVVRVRVHGEFPVAEDDVFIPLPMVERAITAGLDYAEPAPPGLLHIGCDVARFGSDKTVIGYKVDAKIAFHSKQVGQDTMKTADKIIELGDKLRTQYRWPGKIPIKIDDGGVGGGVVDRLRQMKRSHPERFAWMEIFPVRFGARIQNRFYHDSTSYMTSVVKSLLATRDEDGQQKPIELILPNDDNLAGQLSCRKYRLTDAGKIQVESKEAMKKRGLPSPDEADCVLLLCLPVRMQK